MEKLLITGTKSSPEIDFNADTGILKISGNSYPQNPYKFFEGVFKWVDDYMKTARSGAVFEIKLNYMNSSSVKCLMNMIYKAERAATQGKKCVINWHYDKNNRSIKDSGEVLRDLANIEFNIIESA